MIDFNSSLPNYYATEFLKKPIRSKIDSLYFLFNVLEFINICDDVNYSSNDHKIVVVSQNRISRVFFCSPEKIYSINFPFKITQDDAGKKYINSTFGRINEKMVSIFKRLLSIEGLTEEEDFYSLISNYEEVLSDFDIQHDELCIWPLFVHLLKMEDGYFRYDYDPNRAEGHVHPLHHIDLFYSRCNQIKVGLYNNTSYEDIICMIDPQEECYYLTKQEE